MPALDLSDYADFVLTKTIKTAHQQNAKMDIVVVAEKYTGDGDSAEAEQVDEKLFEDAARAALSYAKSPCPWC
jgi:RNase P protein component